MIDPRFCFMALALFIVATVSAVADLGDTVTPAEQVIATGLDFPEGPSLSPDGKFLYCVNVHDADITRVDLTTGEVKKDWVVLPSPGRGNGSTIGPDGALYITDVGRKLIARISLPDGALSTYVDSNNVGQPFLGPNDLCFDSSGNLFFTDPGNSYGSDPIGAAYVAHEGTKTVELVGAGLAFPNGLVVTKDGTVYIDQTPLGTITAFKKIESFYKRTITDPVYSSSPFATVMPGLDGMRIDKFGNIYVAVSGGGRVVKVDPSGNVVKTYLISAGKGVTNLCFTKDGKGLYVTETESNQILKVKL